MKPFYSFVLLGISLGFTHPYLAHANEGGAVRNGGSGYLCKDQPMMVIEYVIAARYALDPPLDDRELFITRILSKIRNPLFQDLLRKQWDRYGDSENWPNGDLNGIEVYYPVSALQEILYG